MYKGGDMSLGGGMSLGPVVAPALLSCENVGGARFAPVICADLQGGALCALWATPSCSSTLAAPEMAGPVAIQADGEGAALCCWAAFPTPGAVAIQSDADAPASHD